MFDFDISDRLKIKISKLIKKDKKKAEILQRKIKEIINRDKDTIQHYKNLRYDLSEYKRVHIDEHFVLAFKVDLAKNFILFYDFDHHDKIYENLKRK
jgi:mRNA-degrading endonuclease RelE of RelBE toxin-antitoxin system